VVKALDMGKAPETYAVIFRIRHGGRSYLNYLPFPDRDQVIACLPAIRRTDGSYHLFLLG
jgi:hypothetical protein